MKPHKNLSANRMAQGQQTSRAQLAYNAMVSAREYHVAYLAALRAKETLFGKEYRAIRPAYVLCAFACELYLKSMLYRDETISLKSTQGRDGHCLHYLYRRLNDRDKRAIIVFMQMKGYTEKNVYKGILKSSSSFTQLRYSFSHKKVFVCPDFLNNFVHSLFLVSAAHNNK